MGKETIIDRIKDFIGSIAWKVFIWSIEMSREEYWRAIYHQEKAIIETQDTEEG